ncbi:MAG: RNA methyltransferase [Eubacteriales bacterium]|nr:RNA methyltransferase [Eubacteriales bacterium]
MISSTTNSRIKNIVQLKKSAKARKDQGCFLVEGPRMFFEVPKSQLKEVYVTEAFEKKYEAELSGYRYEVISENVCKHISDTKTPQGVTALVKQSSLSFEELLNLEKDPLFIVLENLQDPGNLGTILRTAEGAGVTGIIMNRETVDPYNPKVIRSTMGTIFRVPFVIVDDLHEALGRLKKAGVASYAAHLGGDSFYQQDYTKGSAFLIGNEGNGLTDEITSMAEHKIKIPMKGQVESLNAAIASTVLVYEAQRQRGWR